MRSAAFVVLLAWGNLRGVRESGTLFAAPVYLYLGSILGSSVMAAVLSGSTPPVDNFRVLYAALFLSSCGAIITAWGLPTWIRGAGRSETGP